MKKFAALLGSVLMFVVLCLQPLTVNAAISDAEDFNESDFLPDSYYYWSFAIINESDNYAYKYTWKILKSNFNLENSVTFANNILNIDVSSYKGINYYYYNANQTPYNSLFTAVNEIQFDFNTNLVSLTLDGTTYSGQQAVNLSNPTNWKQLRNGTTYFSNFHTNIPYSDPNALNVEVIFNPALVGQVDRSVTTGDGNTAMKQSLFMNVINHSSFPIQYDMVIMKKNIVSVRGGNAFQSNLDSDDPSLLSQYTLQYDDDPAFIYYSDDWVYTHGMDSELQYWDNNTYKFNKATRWHYLAANSSVVQQFDFSQIHLVEGEEYVVSVRAIRNDYGIASEKIVYLASSDPAYPELKQIQGDDIETVYTSEFSMLQYNDVVYDPNNSMNGIKPYDGQNGIVDKQRYSWSRNASEDSDGNIDYTSVNHLDNSNSWVNRQYGGVVTNHKKLVSGTQSFGGLNTIISPVVLFVSTTFGFLPLPLQSAFYLGFFAIVVIAVIKKVFA